MYKKSNYMKLKPLLKELGVSIYDPIFHGTSFAYIKTILNTGLAGKRICFSRSFELYNPKDPSFWNKEAILIYDSRELKQRFKLWPTHDLVHVPDKRLFEYESRIHEDTHQCIPNKYIKAIVLDIRYFNMVDIDNIHLPIIFRDNYQYYTSKQLAAKKQMGYIPDKPDILIGQEKVSIQLPYYITEKEIPFVLSKYGFNVRRYFFSDLTNTLSIYLEQNIDPQSIVSKIKAALKDKEGYVNISDIFPEYAPEFLEKALALTDYTHRGTVLLLPYKEKAKEFNHGAQKEYELVLKDIQSFLDSGVKHLPNHIVSLEDKVCVSKYSWNYPSVKIQTHDMLGNLDIDTTYTDTSLTTYVFLDSLT